MTYHHYGWPVSPYSAKTRAYFRFKKLAFEDHEPTARQLMTTIKRAVGRPIMPTVLTPEGTWLQDSSAIIDALEARHPTPTITPAGPTQRLASLLLELHADEWLPMVIMHTRWNLSENARFARREFGRYGFPWLPSAIATQVAKPLADRMQGYRSVLGVEPGTIEGIERFARTLIERLQGHFADHPFLLGSRPCMGDFALYGPLWAHVFRDPATAGWFDAAPDVIRWFERLGSGEGGSGAYVPDDEIPATLDGVFATLFDEHWRFLTDLVAAVDLYCRDHPGAKRVPRSLGDHTFVVGGCTGRRRLITATQWMLQRPLDVYRGLSGPPQEKVDAWLDRVGGRQAMALTIHHRFVFEGFRMRLADSA